MKYKIELLTFIIGLFVNPNLGECPANWMTGPAGSCFKFVLSPGLSWQEAEGSCIDMGGNLAALDTQLKTAVINGYFIMQPKLRDTKWWIGGKKINNKWSWAARPYPAYALTFNYWFPGEPNNSGSGEACLELYAHAENYKWNDIPCHDKKPYICEMHQSDVIG